jgi:hypothetical protein
MIFDKLVILVGWLYWWSAPTLVGEPSCSLNKVGRGTGRGRPLTNLLENIRSLAEYDDPSRCRGMPHGDWFDPTER